MGSPLDLRASDAERDHAVDLLRHHATAGRITVEELAEKSSARLVVTGRAPRSVRRASAELEAG
jgi:hypothetical protein